MALIACSKGHQATAGTRFCPYCGEALQPSGSQPPNVSPAKASSGVRLRDRYLIQSKLGQGGFGRTFLAKDLGRFEELVTIKEFCPSLQGTQALQKAEELFQREAATLHKLQHPQIPRFFEIFREGKRLFIVQEFIEGQTYQSLLEDRLQQGQRFSEVEIIQLMEGLLPVLTYLHEQGIIHRDIAPDNIIRRSKDGLPILIDLGGIKEIAITITTQINGLSNATSTRLGKVGYAPDEQLRLGTIAPHSDLYALAVTAIVLMTGKQPQELLNQNTLNWVWHKEVIVSPSLEKILNRMLHRQPSQRFQSAVEVLQTLKSGTLKPAYTTAKATPANANLPPTVLNNSVTQNANSNVATVPDNLNKWNWGAFLLPGFWCLPNRVWVGLLIWATILIPAGFIPSQLEISIASGIAAVFGAHGNKWAWKSRKWNSVAAFKAHQRAWAKWSFITYGIIFALAVLIGFLSASRESVEESGRGSQIPISPSSRNQRSINEYPPEEIEAFISSCVQATSASAPNISIESIRSYCVCAANEVQRKMNFQDYLVADSAYRKYLSGQHINADEQRLLNIIFSEVFAVCQSQLGL